MHTFLYYEVLIITLWRLWLLPQWGTWEKRAWEETGVLLRKQAENVYKGHFSLGQVVVSQNVKYVLKPWEGWEVSPNGCERTGHWAVWENWAKKNLFNFFPPHFSLGYSWDVSHIMHTQGIFPNGLCVLDVMFLEQSRLVVPHGRLCFRMEGNLTKGGSLSDKIYDSSRDKVHFLFHSEVKQGLQYDFRIHLFNANVSWQCWRKSFLYHSIQHS